MSNFIAALFGIVTVAGLAGLSLVVPPPFDRFMVIWAITWGASFTVFHRRLRRGIESAALSVYRKRLIQRINASPPSENDQT